MNLKTIDYKTTLVFGPQEDRVIESVGVIAKRKAFEVGYYNGHTKPKAIINISPASGCPVGCNFCDLQDSGGPLSAQIMLQQVFDMAKLATKIDGKAFLDKPLKVNFAKTGEPLLKPLLYFL